MTDRVQQMLDVVKDNFEGVVKRPRLRRSRRDASGSMRAEVREGILKHPYLPSGTAPRARGLQETQTGFSGPRHPDVWRDAPVQTAGSGGKTNNSYAVDPADAALAAFREAKVGKKGRAGAMMAHKGLSFDRPRMDESLPRQRGGRPRSANIRRGKTPAGMSIDSGAGLELAENPKKSLKIGWIRALFGSRKGR